MHTIEIDFDVQKALWARRTSAEQSFNDVLRGIFGLPAAKASEPSSRTPDGSAWFAGGATFPSGTDFRARYKGATIPAKVENGALVLNGKRFNSPSAAAASITGSPVNGWTFWQARLPGQSEWKVIAGLRP